MLVISSDFFAIQNRETLTAGHWFKNWKPLYNNITLGLKKSNNILCTGCCYSQFYQNKKGNVELLSNFYKNRLPPRRVTDSSYHCVKTWWRKKNHSFRAYVQKPLSGRETIRPSPSCQLKMSWISNWRKGLCNNYN